MKKFSFSLETVLTYKNIVLDDAKSVHGEALIRVNNQKEYIKNLKNQLIDFNAEFNEKNEKGMTIIEVNVYKSYFSSIERKIENAYLVLYEFQKDEAQKRQNVVDAKVETSSIEKLKEKKLEVYNKSVARSEELFIEEFVNNLRFSS